MICKILLVDDDPGIVRLVSKALESEGHVVDSASDGEAGLELARDGGYTLVITDITLPQMSGLDFLKSLRRKKPDVPVILISAFAEFDNAKEGLNLGAAAFLVKPFDNKELLKWVDRIIKTKEKSQALGHLFEKFSFESHEIELDTAALLSENNLYLLTSYLSEQFRVCCEVNRMGRLKRELAIHEALRNSAEHGNLELDSCLKPDSFNFGAESPYDKLMGERLADPKYARRKIRVAYSCLSGKMALTIRDEGNGFDHKKVFAYQQLDDCQPHGRGLLMIRTGMDEVSFNNKGNEITMSAKLSG